MEQEKFDELLNDIRCATFHMNDEEAKPIINRFLKIHPELLNVHEIEWYYNYC